ncbi:MAG: alpha-E domain-containing protein [Chitinophagaceae bacterium]|nr:alpha-E domain-containing protein [Chitinophagaceae bacterium]
MLSRIADSLFWLHRYMERADGLLRLLKTSYILSFDKVEASSITWEPALKIFTSLSAEEIAALQSSDTVVLQYLLTDVDNQNSLKVIITRARENARGVQDQITKEVWEQVNQMYHLINDASLPDKLAGPDAIVAIDALISSSDQFIGITDSTMPRGQGWNYMNLGKYIERCLLTAEFALAFFRPLDFDLNNEQDILYWRSLLLALSGYELHLKNYNSQNHNWNVATQVLFDKNFPRSLYYATDRAVRYLSEIVEQNPVAGTPALNRMFGRLCSSVKFAELEMVAEAGLEKYLLRVRKELNEFSRLFGQVYFSYA